jgi:hypothetical protein
MRGKVKGLPQDVLQNTKIKIGEIVGKE